MFTYMIVTGDDKIQSIKRFELAIWGHLKFTIIETYFALLDFVFLTFVLYFLILNSNLIVCVYLYKDLVSVFNIAISNSDYIASNRRMKMNSKIPTGKKIGRDVM